MDNKERKTKGKRPRLSKFKIEGAFWGRGKCPECGRLHQKDIRIVYYWDKAKEKILFFKKMCSWCVIIFYAKCLKKGLELLIDWHGYKEHEERKLR